VAFACLLVTGHRWAAERLIPEECEYVHLPSWDSLLDPKASHQVAGSMEDLKLLLAGVPEGRRGHRSPTDRWTEEWQEHRTMRVCHCLLR